MDKIYSRGLKKPRYLKAVVILIIGLVTMTLIIKAINPIIDKLCVDACKSKATIITNQKTTEVMDGVIYSDIVTIYRDSSDNITMLESNIPVINTITSDIAIEIQQELNNDEENTMYISFGSFTGIKIFSGIGPKIPIKLSNTGVVETKVRSEFEEAGINQTIHRLYLDVMCKVSILTPYDVIETEITNEVILIENIIVGLVPSTYLDLEY